MSSKKESAGAAFLRNLREALDLEVHEEAVAEQIAGVLDTIERLQEVIDSTGVVVKGSRGQDVLSGAIAEQRQQRLLLTKLFATLGIENAEDATPRKYGTAPVVDIRKRGTR